MASALDFWWRKAVRKRHQAKELLKLIEDLDVQQPEIVRRLKEIETE